MTYGIIHFRIRFFLSFCSISFPDNIAQPGSFPKSQEKPFETDFTTLVTRLQVTKPQCSASGVPEISDSLQISSQAIVHHVTSYSQKKEKFIEFIQSSGERQVHKFISDVSIFGMGHFNGRKTQTSLTKQLLVEQPIAIPHSQFAFCE